MYLSNRQSKIVFELLHNDIYITGQYLGNATGVTSRTIRGDIKELNEELINTELHINSESSRGYYIPKDQREQWIKLTGEKSEYLIPILPDSRIEHILKQLILHPKGISTEIISKQLYVSKSTLDRDLIKITKTLEDGGLKLAKRTGNIVGISGDEYLIREMYKEAFLNVIKLHSMDTRFSNEELNKDFEKANNAVYKAAEKYDVILTGDEFDAITVFLCVILFRNNNGFILQEYDKDNYSHSELTGSIIKTLKEEMEFNIYEEKYAACWIDKIINKSKKIKNMNLTKRLIQDGIAEVNKTFDYNFGDSLSEKLYEILLGYHIKSSEYYVQDISKEYPVALEMAVSLVNNIKHKIDIDVCDDALAKIVMLFVCETEKDTLSKELNERDIVIVCQSGDFTTNLIKTRIKRYFPSFNILGAFPLYKIDKALKLKPEMIISTVMIESSDIPLIVINPLFKDYDILKISTLIKQIEHKESVGYEFLNLFREELFVKDIDITDKYEAVKVLSDAFKTNGYAQDNFYQAVVERENISSTAIGNMVAVPHAVGNDSGENVIAVGILKKPIDWNGDKVQLVFEINIKNAADGNVKQIFSSFFNLVSSNRKIERLIKSKNYYEFLKTINQ